MVKKIKIQLNSDMSFEEGFKEFIDSRKAMNLRPATINHYEESYKSIIRFFDKDISIKNITQREVDKFIRECGKLNIKSQTLFTYTRDLKTILYYFIKMDYMKTFKITLPKVDKEPIETYTDAELKILILRMKLLI